MVTIEGTGRGVISVRFDGVEVLRKEVKFSIVNKRGIIFKGIGGFYYVHAISDDGTSLKREIYCCKARGILKNKVLLPCVGDVVEVDVIDGKEGIIEKIEKERIHL